MRDLVFNQRRRILSLREKAGPGTPPFLALSLVPYLAPGGFRGAPFSYPEAKADV